MPLKPKKSAVQAYIRCDESGSLGLIINASGDGGFHAGPVIFASPNTVRLTLGCSP